MKDKDKKKLNKLNATQDEWKLRAMGTTIGCHTIVKKGTEGNDIKTYDLTWGAFCDILSSRRNSSTYTKLQIL